MNDLDVLERQISDPDGEWTQETAAEARVLIQRLRDAETFNWSITVKRLEARIAQLERVLDKYAWHRPACAHLHGSMGNACSCGYDAAVAVLDPPWVGEGKV